MSAKNSPLLKVTDRFDLSQVNFDSLSQAFAEKLKGRSKEACIFGSFAEGTSTAKSDIDLIIIVETDLPFTKRGELFLDFFDVYPALDILVYTPSEFENQLKRNDGFWTSINKTKRKIL